MGDEQASNLDGREPAPGARRFRIAVGRCLRCGREWPVHVEICHACAATVGNVCQIPCVRLVAPVLRERVEPMLAVVAAIELSQRAPTRDGVTAPWPQLEAALAGAAVLLAGPAGTVVAAWPLDRSDAVVRVADRLLGLGERLLDGPGPRWSCAAGWAPRRGSRARPCGSRSGSRWPPRRRSGWSASMWPGGWSRVSSCGRWAWCRGGRCLTGWRRRRSPDACQGLFFRRH
jgi:hypothetical protein